MSLSFFTLFKAHTETIRNSKHHLLKVMKKIKQRSQKDNIPKNGLNKSILYNKYKSKNNNNDDTNKLKIMKITIFSIDRWKIKK